jgi:hypothetical protein
MVFEPTYGIANGAGIWRGQAPVSEGCSYKFVSDIFFRIRSSSKRLSFAEFPSAVRSPLRGFSKDSVAVSCIIPSIAFGGFPAVFRGIPRIPRSYHLLVLRVVLSLVRNDGGFMLHIIPSLAGECGLPSFQIVLSPAGATTRFALRLSTIFGLCFPVELLKGLNLSALTTFLGFAHEKALPSTLSPASEAGSAVSPTLTGTESKTGLYDTNHAGSYPAKALYCPPTRLTTD